MHAPVIRCCRVVCRPRVVVLSLIAIVAFTLTPGLAAMRGRLQVAPDHRHLQDADGTPFFYLGDTAWELFHHHVGSFRAP